VRARRAAGVDRVPLHTVHADAGEIFGYLLARCSPNPDLRRSRALERINRCAQRAAGRPSRRPIETLILSADVVRAKISAAAKKETTWAEMPPGRGYCCV